MVQTKHVEVLLNDANHAQSEFLIYMMQTKHVERVLLNGATKNKAFTTVSASISGPFGGDAVAALEV